MSWRRLIIVLITIGSLLGILAYGFNRDPRYISSPLLGRQASPFTLLLFDGRQLSLADLRGKIVFVTFWASWCPPCRAEATELEAAWQRFKDRDVVFLGINIQDTEENARAFLKEFNISYLNGRDPTGKVAIEYGVWGIPEAFFIDRRGQITYKHVGTLGPDVVAIKLEEASSSLVSAKEGKGSYQPIR